MVAVSSFRERIVLHAVAIIAVSLLFIRCGPPPSSVEGRVVDIVSRDAISDIVVNAETSTDIKEELTSALVSTRTNAEGNFRLSGLLPSRRYTLSTDDSQCTINESTIESPLAGQTRLLQTPVLGFCAADGSLASVIPNSAILINLRLGAPLTATEALIRSAATPEDLVAFEYSYDRNEIAHLFLILAAITGDEARTMLDRLVAGGAEITEFRGLSVTTLKNLPERATYSVFSCRDTGSKIALFNTIGKAALTNDDQNLVVLEDESDVVSDLFVISADWLHHRSFSPPEGCMWAAQIRLNAAKLAGVRPSG